MAVPLFIDLSSSAALGRRHSWGSHATPPILEMGPRAAPTPGVARGPASKGGEPARSPGPTAASSPAA